jgi:hypothetical protein
MPLLNNSIPYLMRIELAKTGYQDSLLDYFVGGFPVTDKTELGSIVLYKSSNHGPSFNLTGRVFESENNQTFSEDLTMTVYNGYGEYNRTSFTPYERLEFIGQGQFYTGYYELFNLEEGPNIVIAEAKGYHNNFQRFYAFPSPPYTSEIRPIPMVKQLDPSQLEIILTWSHSPKDLDLHVEFIASPTILCKSDYTMKHCGGVELLTDSQNSGEKGADVIKFNYIGDFQYIVYVSVYQGPKGPKAGPSDELSLSESQAQIKVFAPYYAWPIYTMEVPSLSNAGDNKYWSAFCFSGQSGLKDVRMINELSNKAPDVSRCN